MIERGKGTKQITWTQERIEHLRQAFEIDGKDEAEIRLELNLLPGQTISSDSAVFYKARAMKLHRSPGFKSRLRHTLRVSFLQQQANARARAMKQHPRGLGIIAGDDAAHLDLIVNQQRCKRADARTAVLIERIQ